MTIIRFFADRHALIIKHKHLLQHSGSVSGTVLGSDPPGVLFGSLRVLSLSALVSSQDNPFSLSTCHILQSVALSVRYRRKNHPLASVLNAPGRAAARPRCCKMT